MRFALLACLLVGAGCEEKPASAPQPSPAPPGAAAPAPPAPTGPAAPTSAISGPLGSRTNPVRCDFPAGERAYLSRLRCPDGSRPSFNRTGSVGAGPYGNILDLYEVKCGGQSYQVFMDMYFKGYVEKQAVPGFKIVK